MSEIAATFGALTTQTLNLVDPINNATIPNNTIPTQMFTGQSLWVDITARNTGNTSWMQGGNYYLNVNSDPCGLFSAGIFMQGNATPNTNAPMIAYITAPLTPGSCAIQLQMAENPGPGVFGAILNKTINVVTRPNATHDWTVFE